MSNAKTISCEMLFSILLRSAPTKLQIEVLKSDRIILLNTLLKKLFSMHSYQARKLMQCFHHEMTSTYHSINSSYSIKTVSIVSILNFTVACPFL